MDSRESSNWFEIRQVLQQGCVLAPLYSTFFCRRPDHGEADDLRDETVFDDMVPITDRKKNGGGGGRG